MTKRQCIRERILSLALGLVQFDVGAAAAVAVMAAVRPQAH